MTMSMQPLRTPSIYKKVLCNASLLGFLTLGSCLSNLIQLLVSILFINFGHFKKKKELSTKIWKAENFEF